MKSSLLGRKVKGQGHRADWHFRRASFWCSAIIIDCLQQPTCSSSTVIWRMNINTLSLSKLWTLRIGISLFDDKQEAQLMPRPARRI